MFWPSIFLVGKILGREYEQWAYNTFYNNGDGKKKVEKI